MSATPIRTTPVDDAIRIAVVGHTNAGKTSLLRTLTRRQDFGEVASRPGTTRHVETVELAPGGHIAIRFFDTPGLEDAVTLREHLAAFAEVPTPPERIRRFLQSPEAHGVFEQEAKVLRTLLEVDAAFLVIDVREPVLPKYRDEIELIGSCGRPVLPVLNFVRDTAQREPEWKALLAAYGLHAVVRFDAAAPFVGAERALYQDLVTLLRDRRAQLDAVTAHLATEAAQRRDAAAARIAELLVDVASMRRTVPAGAEVSAAVADLRRDVFDKAQRCADDLLSLHGFRVGDTAEAPLPQVEGRWSMDFFSAEAMKNAGIRLGQGAAVGAALGVALDLAVGGLSLGAGAALGGALGGALMQGWGPLGRKLANRLRDLRELSVEDAVLIVLLVWQVDLWRALAQRGHAATGPLAPFGPVAETSSATASASALPRPLVQAAIFTLRPARSHPEWEAGSRRKPDIPHRAALMARLAQDVQRIATSQPPKDPLR
ncbi:MAG: GTPase/DUF3482 domain-containing protein [Pseudomonadota bacterium]